MTSDDAIPTPEPPGDLAPPVLHSPVAVEVTTPSSEPLARAPDAWLRDRPPLLTLVDRAVTLALDALDAAGDAVAERLGIRRAAGEPPASPPP